MELRAGDRLAAIVDADRVGQYPGPWMIAGARVWVDTIRSEPDGAVIVLTTKEPKRT